MAGLHCTETPAGEQITTGPPSVTVNVSLCVPCFFPHHCPDNTTCLTGTTGPGCELCQNPSQDGKGYQMLGSSCVACSGIPVAAVTLAVFFFMMFLCMALTRNSSAAVTKIKIFINFVQLAYLALFVKVEWPPLIRQLTSVLSFSTFSSDIAMMECLLPDVKFPSYMRWLTAVGIPSFIFCVGSCIDRGIRNKVKTAKQEYFRVRFEKRRSELRYFLLVIVLSYYMPVALSAVQSFSCSATFSQMIAGHYTNVFLYDRSVSCEDFLFQTFNFVLTLFMIVYIVLMPLLLIFFTLRQRKWALLDCKSSKFGCLYNSYRNTFCFWESLTMVRKIASIGVTNTILMNPLLQAIILLSMSGFYLLLLLAARPYRYIASTVGYHFYPTDDISAESKVVCTLSLCVVHTGALLLALHLYPSGQLDLLLLSVIVLAVLLWLGCALAGKQENMASDREVSFAEDIEVRELPVVKPLARIKRNQVGEYVTTQEADQRVTQVEF